MGAELKEFKINKTEHLPLGSEFTNRGIRFSAVFPAGDRMECGVVLFPDGAKEAVRIPFPKWSRRGKICAMEIVGENLGSRYMLYEGDNIFPDPYMKAADGMGGFGVEASPVSVVYRDMFEHKCDIDPIPFHESIFYMLHVRGFTAHGSSRVGSKGTFKGVIHKLPYLKELGVTSLVLMPVYEFNEITVIRPSVLNTDSVGDSETLKFISRKPSGNVPESIRDLGKFRNSDEPSFNEVNFWGYTGGFYYMPKTSYSSSSDPIYEFHTLVEAAHENGMEIILQFCFPGAFTSVNIVEILRYWRECFHVDGFQLVGSSFPVKDIIDDPILFGIKLLYDENIFITDSLGRSYHGQLDMGFMTDMRCFLKGDPNMADKAAGRMRDADPLRHPINFMARQDTMRLFDIVSYNEKHNYANGENGRDGADCNYSWNCGIEGPTRKKNISALRIKQIKNALALTLLSQGSPMIYSGDEFGNTQYGNNNPYNQDNETGYIKWPTGGTGKELKLFTAELIKIRNSHPAFRSDHQLTGRDLRSFGFPDISFHGEQLWRPDLGPTSHSFGILYYDRYFDEDDDRLVFVIFNMHWQEKNMAIPLLSGKYTWSLSLTSDQQNTYDYGSSIRVAPRSMVILETEGCKNDTP